MDTTEHKLADIGRSERHGFRVADNLADMPVSDAELDAVEAFLMAAFRAFMAGESRPTQKDSSVSDLDQPVLISPRKTDFGVSRFSRAEFRIDLTELTL